METKQERLRRQKREWAARNRDICRNSARKYYQKNKEKCKAYQKDHQDRYNENKKRRYNESPHFRAKINYYSQVGKMIRRYRDGQRLNKSPIEDILGVDKMTFIKHLESTLPKGKTIKNDYGRGMSKYEVDHIIPCDQFDLATMKDVKMCFNWRNMRLIKKTTNLKRGRACDVPVRQKNFKNDSGLCEYDKDGKPGSTSSYTDGDK